MSTSLIKSPYPYFGGKARIAPIVWQALGKIANYVEPFAGSLAVLLACPNQTKIETVNDIDSMIANFWRAISSDPEGVAKFADYPVHEVELHARHQWLLSQITDEFKLKMNSDPNFFNIKMAGYWIWGMGASVGNNWLQPKGLKAAPLLSSAGGGIHGLTNDILDWFKKLQVRTRRVRVCCGDWSRIVTPSVTYNSVGISPKDITGVFLDPPYDLNKRDKVYKEDSNIYKDVCKWAFDNGDNQKLRIVLCGYEGDITPPIGWRQHAWKADGGLANRGSGQGKINATRETIYFSPHCEAIK